MSRANYSSNVFINCPFDGDFLEIRNAIVFAVFDCGFTPRCALEESNSGNVRFDKIQKIIQECKYGIHDISCTELDAVNGLPRFNMPLELGVFVGAKRYGDRRQKEKNCIILDRDRYRYQIFISDIAGHDIRSHEADPEEAIRCVRDWLNDASGRKTIPGGREIVRRFRLFEEDLPALCAAVPIEVDELTYNDYAQFIAEWLRQSAEGEQNQAEDRAA
jgi:hypothetical protein